MDSDQPDGSFQWQGDVSETRQQHWHGRCQLSATQAKVLVGLDIQPVSCLGWRTWPEWSIPRRTLADTFLFLPWEGAVDVAFGSTVQRLNPGHLALIAEGQEHAITYVPGCTSVSAIAVHIRCLSEAGLAVGTSSGVFSLADPKRWLEDFRTVTVWYGQQPQVAGAALGLVTRLLLAQLCDAGLTLEDGGPRVHPRLVAALEQARRAPETPVATLAQLAGISETRFRILVRHSTGLSPKAWLDRQRLDQAASMLRRDHLPVAEIARQCGFASVRRLQIRFLAAYGCSPHAWRQSAASVV